MPPNARITRLPAFGAPLVFGALLCGMLLPRPALADPFDLTADPQALAQGGAVVAHAVGPAALQFNPAGLAQIRQYALSFNYGYQGSPDNHAVSVAATDSLLNPRIGGGMSYAYQVLKINGIDDTGGAHRLRGALTLAERGQAVDIFAGVTGHWDKESVGDFSRDVFNLDVGLLLVFQGMLRVGVVGVNLLDRTDQGQQREMAVGVGIAVERFQFEYDLRTLFDGDPTTGENLLQHAVGAQFSPLSYLALRGGYRRDSLRKSNVVTGGFGFTTETFGLSVAYAQEVGRDGEQRRWVVATFRSYLHF